MLKSHKKFLCCLWMLLVVILTMTSCSSGTKKILSELFTESRIADDKVIITQVSGKKAITVKETINAGVKDIANTITCNNDYLPKEYASSSTDEARYIVLITKRYYSEGKYDDGTHGYSIVCDVHIVDRSTGESHGRNTFSGNAPPKVKTGGGNAFGSEPDVNEISKWIKNILDKQ